jgi:hypothetical protein
MIHGMPHGAMGDPDKHIKTLETVPTSSGIRFRLEAPTGLGNAYYQAYINNVLSGSVWVPEGEFSSWLTVGAPAGDVSFVVFRAGNLADFDAGNQARYYEETANTVKASWNWEYEVLGTPADIRLTNWVLTGISRSQVTQAGTVTRGNILVTVEVDGTDIDIDVGGFASGSGTTGDTITLNEINNSGISGTVDTLPFAETSTPNLSIRWPKQMEVLRGTSSPPTEVVLTVPYDAEDTGTAVDSEGLEVGNYYYAFRAVSDTDDEGDLSTPELVTVSGVPEPVTDLDYVSGGASATVVSWTASATVGATYNIYIANPDDDFLDTETPAATAIAGATGATLPAITGFPGVAQVLVRAVFGGEEEKNGDILSIEYDASGVVVNPRPNVPYITSVGVLNGTSINIEGSYNPTDEEGVATALQLFVREPGSTYNFGVVDATGTLGPDIGGTKTATITKVESNGWHYVTLKAVTADSAVSAGYAPEVAVYVSDVNAEAPTGTFTVTRG